MTVAATDRPPSQPIDIVPSGAEDALDHLVNQFADPLAFLRELVQNAIDAGSAEVEVRCEFTPAPREVAAAARPPGPLPAPGTLVIHVEDWGCGMDRQVIDHRLTRLFASDKEGDRTKIGKFGIGFVSVFALRPDAVCVDTGRAGESFRVLFHADRTFTRIRLSEPVEGTKIRIIKAMTQGEATALARRVKKALRFYCRHVQLELRYDGELLSGPLSLTGTGPSGDDPGPSGEVLQLAERTPEMHVVCGFTPPHQADLAGFYNRGLTLLEQPSGIAGISFKVDSPQLLHTLSRDAVIKDACYHRALATVQRLCAGPLLEALGARLEAALVAAEPPARIAALQQLLADCRRRGPLPPGCAERLCARAAHGELVKLTDCAGAAANQRLYLTEAPSPLTQQVAAAGGLVLLDWQRELARALCEGSEPPHPAAVYVLPLPPPLDLDAAAAAVLCGETLALLGSTPAAVAAVELGQLDAPSGAAEPPPALAQEQPFTLSRLRHAALGEALLRGPKRTLILNYGHETVRALLPLARCEPELAAYTMTKLCLPGTAMSVEQDGRLLALALARRCRRLGR